jgi:hypothetical protein
MTEGSPFGQFQSIPDALMKLPFNIEKDQARRRLLAEKPELRLRIDTSRLKPIIDYVVFKCHHFNSIARDVAIKGSDIDAGLVVLKEEIPTETQLAFINELRRQGFDIYHPNDITELRRKIKNTSNNQHHLDLLRHVTKAEYNQINFIPVNDLQSRKQALGAAYQIYGDGFTIK